METVTAAEQVLIALASEFELLACSVKNRRSNLDSAVEAFASLAFAAEAIATAVAADPEPKASCC